MTPYAPPAEHVALVEYPRHDSRWKQSKSVHGSENVTIGATYMTGSRASRTDL